MEKTKLLIVDDEDDIREILEFNLRNEGYDIDTANSAEDALKMLTPEHRLIILDVMMGGMSGYKMTEKLRKDGLETPIIFLTAKNTENDMLTGFSTGGDDYISKPFSIKEVCARVKAVLKRIEISDTKKDTLSVGSLLVNLRSKQVHINDMVVSLTRTEFEILILLMKNLKQVYTREAILDIVWKENGYVMERTVDVHIARLRKKIGEYGQCIVKRSGYGYSFDDSCQFT